MLRTRGGSLRMLWPVVPCLAVCVSAAATAPPAPRGAYLGQAPPGLEPALFAPDFLATDLCERDITFTPDGREIYLSIQGGNTFADWFSVIAYTRQGGDDRWTAPRLAPFSGRYTDMEPCVSPDGRRLYFASNRPLSGAGEPRPDFDIWYAERAADGWSEPRNPGAPINSGKEEFYPSLTADGTLYFTAEREGGRGGEDLWRARPAAGGGFAEPENLGDSVNTADGEYNAFVARDESYLIFGRRNDLFVSFRRADGTWTRAVAMGAGVNSPRMDYCPSASPDGEYLFFTSTRYPGRDYAKLLPVYEALEAQIPDPGHRRLLRIRLFPYEDLYWVRSEVLEPLRQAALR